VVFDADMHAVTGDLFVLCPTKPNKHYFNSNHFTICTVTQAAAPIYSSPPLQKCDWQLIACFEMLLA